MNITASLNDVTSALYRSSTGLHPTGNFMISPVSIMYATVMLYLGARGKTKSEIYSAARFSSSFRNENDDISGAFGALMKKYQPTGPPKTNASVLELSLANGIFVDPDANISPTYVSKVSKDLLATITPTNFQPDPEVARTQINQWVEGKTSGKVKDLIAIGQVTEGTKSVLVNAVYFKSNWDQKFDPARTKDASFTKLDGTKVKVKMMQRTGVYAVAHDQDLRVRMLNMPYANNEASMLILVPTELSNFRSFEKTFNTTYFESLDQKIRTPRKTIVNIPKFTMEVSSDLKKLMQNMGIKDAFVKDKADLRDMITDQKLYIADAFHKTFIEVDEKGTTAAGASGVSDTLRSGPGLFAADRPFIFAIRHNPTKAIFFIGRYESP